MNTIITFTTNRRMEAVSTRTDGTPLSHRDAVLRMGATSLSFATVYGLCNQLSHWRGGWAEGVFEWERSIPFVPWTIVPYLSIVLFFVASFFVDRQRERLDRHAAAVLIAVAVASLCYLLVPLRTAFERPLTEGPLGLLFGALTATDLPYNRAPSLHVALLVILWARLAPTLPALAPRAARGLVLADRCLGADDLPASPDRHAAGRGARRGQPGRRPEEPSRPRRHLVAAQPENHQAAGSLRRMTSRCLSSVAT